MKRTALLRKTAMRRSKFVTRQRETKQQLRSGDPEYLSWVRRQLCAVCGASPPNHAHHRTGGGMGMKTADSEAFPLCNKHHRELHDVTGWFAGWDKHSLRDWQKQCVRYSQLTYAAVSHQLLEAPGAGK